MWQSKWIRHVVKSTIAAETLALVYKTEASLWLSKLFVEIYNTQKLIALPLNCHTDSKQQHEALYSIRPVLDKRLRVEIGIIGEMLEKK